jgi:hypothetical protein
MRWGEGVPSPVIWRHRAHGNPVEISLSREHDLKPSILKSVLTDIHFWIPVIVLILGVGLLVILR